MIKCNNCRNGIIRLEKGGFTVVNLIIFVREDKNIEK